MDRPFPEQSRLSIGHFFEQAAFAMLLLLAAIFALEHTQPLIDIGPVVLTNVETVITLLILLWLLARLTTGSPFQFPRRLGLPILIWLIVLAISWITAPAYQDKIFLFMGRIVAGILIALAVADMADTEARRWMVVAAAAAAAVVVAALGLVEGFGLGQVVAWLDGFKYAPTRVGDLIRVSSTLSYATIMAMILEMVLPLLLIGILVAKKPAGRLLGIAGVILLLAAHVLTLSRAGVASLMIVLLLMALVGWRRKNRTLVAAAAISAVLLAVLTAAVLLANPVARLRLTSETERNWYQAQYEGPAAISAAAGRIVSVPIQITNAGLRSWSADGELFFALSYHLKDSAGSSVTYDGERSPLPGDINPGESAAVQALIRAPNEPGRYLVEWDMVQEAVTWFSWKDAPTFTTELLVTVGEPAAAAAIAGSPPPTDVRITSPTPGRFQLWQTALQMAADRPLFGGGPDNFRWLYGAYAGVDRWDTGIHANNLYLEWLADTGLVGMLVFLWLSWRLLTMGWATIRQSSGTTWLLSLGLMAGLVVWYLHGFFDYFYEFTPTYVLFWLMVGLLASMTVNSRGKNADRV